MLKKILPPLCSFLFSLCGWKVVGHFPPLKKYVIIIGKHTSNWDFIVAMVSKTMLHLQTKWYAKHTMFFWPFRTLLKKMGGIPIDRRKSHKVVDQAVEDSKKFDTFILALAPEGTRKKVTHWKTGFYQIALGAQIPIVPVAFDYPNRQVIIIEPFYPTGNIAADIGHLQGLFRHTHGHNPKNEMD